MKELEVPYLRRELGEIKVDQKFLIVLALTSFGIGMLAGLWIF